MPDIDMMTRLAAAEFNDERPEFERNVPPADAVATVAAPRPLWRKVLDSPALRRGAVIAVLVVIWQLYATWIDNPLMFPTFGAMAKAFWTDLISGVLPMRVLGSLEVLIVGYATGVAIAAALTTLAVSTRFGEDFLSTVTAMFSPLPAIALLPLAMLWFGLGMGSLVFVLVHAVLWPLAMSAHGGFRAVSPTLRMVGQNYGLKRVPLVVSVLIPAALPSILSGLKISWAFAWRTLIAAELVFGVSSGSGGLGWYIFRNKNELMIENVFAGLVMVVLIGLLVEYALFGWLERRTVRRWGMQS